MSLETSLYNIFDKHFRLHDQDIQHLDVWIANDAISPGYQFIGPDGDTVLQIVLPGNTTVEEQYKLGVYQIFQAWYELTHGESFISEHLK